MQQCLVLTVVVVGLTLGSRLSATPGQLIQAAGYPLEEHTVSTADGYDLSVQRIPRDGSPTVYLQHGLLDSSATWVMNQPSEALAFLLYDAGFDVWLGNQRGNRYSNSMTNGSAYNWYFSMDEMAEFDDAALLKYITSATGRPQLGWVGHSRGTQQMFYGLSRFPEHAAAINVFVALAPVAWVGKMKAEMLRVLADVDTGDVFDRIGYHDFLPSAYDTEDLCVFCRSCCDDLIGSIVGPGTRNASLFNQSNLELWLHHFPAGTSAQEMAHYAQLVDRDNVALYDYGAAGNRAHYGTDTAPEYNLTDIPAQVPIALFTGGEDYLADPADVLRLISTLGRDRFVSITDIPHFNHMSFVWGLDAPKLVYSKVAQLLKQYA